MTDNKVSIFEKLSRHVADGILAGVMPWQTERIPPMVINGEKPLTGINYLLLSQSQYSDPRWCSETEAINKGWLVKPGEKERYAIFSVPAKESKRQDDRQLVGAKMYNLSQLDGPDQYIMPVISQKLVMTSILIMLVRSQANINISNDDLIDFNSDLLTITLPKKNLDTGSVDLNAWNARMLLALAKYGHRHSQERANGYDSFVVSIAHASLCAEYGVSLEGIRPEISLEDEWVKSISRDATYAFRASQSARKVCDFVNQFSPIATMQLKNHYQSNLFGAEDGGQKFTVDINEGLNDLHSLKELKSIVSDSNQMFEKFIDDIDALIPKQSKNKYH